MSLAVDSGALRPKPEPATETQGFNAAARPLGGGSPARRNATFLGASSLAFLKPRLKTIVRPLAAKLAGMGVTANQVTLASLAGSVAVGAVLCATPDNPALFALLPLWLPFRTFCAALDGVLAVEFGQKSRLGGILNEGGDIISDIALFLPLAFVAPFTLNAIAVLIALIVAAEIAGIAGPMLGGDRRLDGPLGKADRSIILAALGLIITALGGLPDSARLLPLLLYGGLILTIWNRLRVAIAGGGETSE